MKNHFILLLFISIPISLLSQTYNKRYSEDIEEVNEYLLVNEYSDALPILQHLEKQGYLNANVEYKLGQCYLNSVQGKVKSISYLERASRNTTPDYKIENTLEKNAPLNAILFLGDAYRINNRIKDAEQAYKKYLSLVKNNNQERAIAEKRIFESQIAQVFLKAPISVQFNKLEPIINDGLGNFNACISGDGKSLVFNRKMKFYDAVFFSTRMDSVWLEPKEITTSLGSDGEFHPTGLSPDGKRMLLTSYNNLTGFDIYESIFKDGKWRKVKLLNNSINSAFYDIDAVYGADGKSIYFSSNRTSGFGGYDLYKAPIDDAGNIGQAENLGSTVNTEWDEKSPTLLDGGNMLAFSSQRKPGMGGYDFFYTKMGADGKWGNVFNAGYPLSTVGDDLGFSTTLLGHDGVITKNDPTASSDEDIYKVWFEELSKFKMIPVTGEVRVKETNGESAFKGLNLYFIDETIKDTIGTVESPEGGKYKIDLYPGDFKLVLNKDNTGSVSQLFTIPSDQTTSDFQLVSDYKKVTEKVIAITKAMAADTIYVANILFEFNKSEISVKEKDDIIKFIGQLKGHKIDRIDLIGFTDCLGNKVYNKSLSYNRALSVKEFFIGNGVSKDLISAIGLGDTAWVAKNKNPDGSDNPSGRIYNRRVEIQIVTSLDSLVIIKKDRVPAHLKP